MSITVGVWVIPLLITIGLFIWSYIESDKGGYFSGFFEFIGAVIGSLVVWLIYFIIF